jgi:hypothetical protein
MMLIHCRDEYFRIVAVKFDNTYDSKLTAFLISIISLTELAQIPNAPPSSSAIT